MESSEQTWVPAVKLLRPQGRRGELLAEPQMDLAHIRPGSTLWMGSETSVPEFPRSFAVEDAWEPTGRNAGRLVLKLAGIEGISAAEAIAGGTLWLRTADLPPLPEDTFLVRDLVGCTLLDGETIAGRVVDVQFPVGADGRTRLADAPDLLVVAPASASDANAEPVLVPFVRAWLQTVDLPCRRMVMNLPPGLFDNPTEDSPADEADTAANS